MPDEPLSAYVRRTGCDEMSRDAIADCIAQLESGATVSVKQRVWFDFEGGCPLCGKSLVWRLNEHGDGPRHATCGGFPRHQWLVYYRIGRLRRDVYTRMRLLKGTAA